MPRVAALALALALLPAALPAGAATPAPAQAPVVLLHGLARGPASMRSIERALVAAGHPVCNVGYPSRRYDLRTLARDHVLPGIRACFPGQVGAVDVVTHSMGGVVLRHLDRHAGLRIRRVVMLAPPNHGSEIVDLLGDLAPFRHLAGPAAQQLRSDVAASGAPPGYTLGILAGNRTLNPLLSLLLPGADDGKVSVASARLAGMRDFRVLPTSHPLILHDSTAIAMILNFLHHGCFAGPPCEGMCLRETGAAARQ